MVWYKISINNTIEFRKLKLRNSFKQTIINQRWHNNSEMLHRIQCPLAARSSYKLMASQHSTKRSVRLNFQTRWKLELNLKMKCIRLLLLSLWRGSNVGQILNNLLGVLRLTSTWLTSVGTTKQAKSVQQTATTAHKNTVA